MRLRTLIYLSHLIIENPANHHAHLLYGVAVPIVTTGAGSDKALRYASAVENAYTEALDSDRGYSSLICKNPNHHDWWTQGCGDLYDLKELSEYVDLTSGKKHRKHLPTCGLGRNCTLFDKLRHWAYRHIAEARETNTMAQWDSLVLQRAQGYNDFTVPLHHSEIIATSRSIAKWTWQVYRGHMTSETFSRKQAERAQKRWQQHTNSTLELLTKINRKE